MVLRRGRDAARDGNVREELPDLVSPHLRRVALAVENDEAPDLVRVCPLGTQAEVAQARDGTHAVEESWFAHGGEARVEVLSSAAREVHHTRARHLGGKKMRLLTAHYGVIPNPAAFAAPLRSSAERCGFSRPITEFCRRARQNMRYASTFYEQLENHKI